MTKKHLKKYRVLEIHPNNTTIFRKVIDITSEPHGLSISYLNQDNRLDLLYCPLNFVPYYLEGRCLYPKVIGSNSVCIIVPIDSDCPHTSLTNLVRNDILSRGMRTLYDKPVIPKWLIIGIISIICIVGISYFANKLFNTQETPITPTNGIEQVLPKDKIQ